MCAKDKNNNNNKTLQTWGPRMSEGDAVKSSHQSMGSLKFRGRNDKPKVTHPRSSRAGTGTQTPEASRLAAVRGGRHS